MKRQYLSPDFKITSWDNLKPLFEDFDITKIGYDSNE